jgi:hypothetical protein
MGEGEELEERIAERGQPATDAVRREVYKSLWLQAFMYVLKDDDGR